MLIPLLLAEFACLCWGTVFLCLSNFYQ